MVVIYLTLISHFKSVLFAVHLFWNLLLILNWSTCCHFPVRSTFTTVMCCTSILTRTSHSPRHSGELIQSTTFNSLSPFIPTFPTVVTVVTVVTGYYNLYQNLSSHTVKPYFIISLLCMSRGFTGNDPLSVPHCTHRVRYCLMDSLPWNITSL